MDEMHVAALSNDELIEATHVLADRSCQVEADLLVHLGEVDARRLYLDRAFPSMYVFCTKELGFSADAAYNRIQVARAARRFPAVVEAVRTGRLHLTGARVLAPHLTRENHVALLENAAGKTKEEIWELLGCFAPRPPVPAAVVPIAPDAFKVQFTASSEFRDDIREAQDLLRHRVPDGDLARIFHMGLKLLIAKVKKERFGVGRKPRQPVQAAGEAASRHVPDSVRRAVYERDKGQCAYVDEAGKRCPETGGLEIDHVDGFARTHSHDLDDLRLLCRAHNQHAADKMYGEAFMDAMRHGTRSGTSPPTA